VELSRREGFMKRRLDARVGTVFIILTTKRPCRIIYLSRLVGPGGSAQGAPVIKGDKLRK
jgi:hypothetical protein